MCAIDGEIVYFLAMSEPIVPASWKMHASGAPMKKCVSMLPRMLMSYLLVAPMSSPSKPLKYTMPLIEKLSTS